MPPVKSKQLAGSGRRPEPVVPGGRRAFGPSRPAGGFTAFRYISHLKGEGPSAEDRMVESHVFKEENMVYRIRANHAHMTSGVKW